VPGEFRSIAFDLIEEKLRVVRHERKHRPPVLLRELRQARLGFGPLLDVPQLVVDQVLALDGRQAAPDGRIEQDDEIRVLEVRRHEPRDEEIEERAVGALRTRLADHCAARVAVQVDLTLGSQIGDPSRLEVREMRNAGDQARANRRRVREQSERVGEMLQDRSIAHVEKI
jgi:hypothetical protein